MIWREVLAQLRAKYEETGVQHRQGAGAVDQKLVGKMQPLRLVVHYQLWRDVFLRTSFSNSEIERE